MASKLELKFNAPGQTGEILTVKTGVNYRFETQRSAFRQVSVYDPYLGLQTPYAAALNFKNAFNTDDNFLGQVTVSIAQIDGTWTVTLVHPDDNYFDGFFNGTTFISHTLTTITTEAEPEVNITFSPSETDPCGKYKLNVATNLIGGTILIEYPVGNPVAQITATGNDSFEFVRPANPSNGSVKIYKGEVTAFADILRVIQAPVQLAITEVKIESSPFGAMATIVAAKAFGATNGATFQAGVQLEYSLDGTSFQTGNNYTGLTEGNYTAYVRDNFGCQKFKTFTVTESQTEQLGAEPYIEFGIHNSIRMVKRKDGLKTFLNFTSGEMPGYNLIKNYTQKYPKEVIRQQFRSAYNDHTVNIVDCDGNTTTFPAIKKSSNISRVTIYEGNYTDIEGKLAVFFGSGNIYNQDGTPMEQGHNLNGFLPDFYEEGLPIQIEGIGSTQIYKIQDDPIEGVTYAVTQLDSKGEGTGKKITTIHNEHEYEVYEFEIDFSVFQSGYYVLQTIYPSGEFVSEVIEVCDEMPENYLEVQWFNNANDFIRYDTGIVPKRWLEYEGYFKLIPKSEREVYYTDTSGYLAKSKSLAVYEVIFAAIPMEDARGLEYAFSNSNVIMVNGVVFIADSTPKVEPVGRTNFYEVTVELTLIEQTMAGQQTINDVIDAGFLIVADDPTAPGFLRIH